MVLMGLNSIISISIISLNNIGCRLRTQAATELSLIVALHI